jgi:hypothetical protein
MGAPREESSGASRLALATRRYLGARPDVLGRIGEQLGLTSDELRN